MALDELCTLLARHARSDGKTAIDDVLISKAQRSSQWSASMTGTVLALVAQGTKHLALGDRIYRYGAGHCLIASVDMPVSGQHVEVSPGRPGLGFGLVLQPAMVAELMLTAAPADLPRAELGTPSGLVVSDADDALVDAVVRLVRLLEQPGDAAVLAPLIKREIVWRALRGEQGATLRQFGLADSNLNHIGRAVGWIRDNYAESFRVEDVARLANMSVSAFYRNFHAVTAMSPIQFQKQIRLQHARLLLAGGPGDVTGVGLRVGYESASQFSREYRRQFGASPRQDAARLRANAWAK